ncbi:hypothetical protein [Empedobacter tilapiae]|uniref:Uncharacterized protein n=1 Tax=Empedobacter tilapiae TaxID=2491114 RepID=A0A4Z1BUP0_9FLAO|nr:hypothetical protein [Empedobacter tilapiae]TGN26075.1 hypothetical protein E4J94_12020 [Empedobacter tilapiae]
MQIRDIGLNDIAAKKGNKLSWEEVQKFFKRGNDFNKKVNSKVPPKYDFNEVTVEQIIDGKIKNID